MTSQSDRGGQKGRLCRKELSEQVILHLSFQTLSLSSPSCSVSKEVGLYQLHHSCSLSLWLLIETVVQSLSHVWLFATPRTAACQASLSITISQSLLKLMSIESVMPSNHLILCHPLLLLPSIFPRIRVFSNIAMNNQGWFPLGLTGLISLLSKGLPRSNGQQDITPRTPSATPGRPPCLAVLSAEVACTPPQPPASWATTFPSCTALLRSGSLTSPFRLGDGNGSPALLS